MLSLTKHAAMFQFKCPFSYHTSCFPGKARDTVGILTVQALDPGRCVAGNRSDIR